MIKNKGTKYFSKRKKELPLPLLFLLDSTASIIIYAGETNELYKEHPKSIITEERLLIKTPGSKKRVIMVVHILKLELCTNAKTALSIAPKLNNKTDFFLKASLS